MNAEIKNALQELINTIEPKIKKIDGPDYYISQSAIRVNPELLIVGINPAGDKKLSQSETPSKNPENLVYDTNKYLENPDWNISRKLNQIMSGKNMQKIYKNAVIMNYIAINTPSEKKLKFPELFEITTQCKMFSKKFIYEVIKPQNIIVLGPGLAKTMDIKFNNVQDSVLRTDDDKSYLVLKKIHNDIPHYLIFHPSTPSLNGFEHINMKKEFFNTEFA